LVGELMASKPWTDEEDALIRDIYPTDATACAARLFPRTSGAVAIRAFRLGVRNRPTWTAADDVEIWNNWGVLSSEQIAEKLCGRTAGAVRARAKKLGLRTGCPNGYEYITRAAKRTGYELNSLRSILRYAGVRIGRSEASLVESRYFVDPFAVDEAIAKWHATETIFAAARRIGMTSNALYDWVQKAAESGVTLPRKPRRKRHWRIPSETIDAIVADGRRRLSLETLCEAAARLKVRRVSLVKWLLAAGIEASGRVWRLEPGVADRVVAERRKAFPLRAPIAKTPALKPTRKVA
jgi:transposase